MGYFIVSVIAACVMIALAFYAYGPRDAAGVKRALGATGSGLLKTYNHILHRADRISERGWRRAFGWSGFAVSVFSFIYAPLHGIQVDYGAVNPFLAFVGATFVTRGVETVVRTRNTTSPTGGLVNESAIA